ncbi:Vacuolar protein sorting-associated protein ist1 [Chytriomyces hyalinus]|nr:Vacuolar protein sorting-associated protein ist1 [Chytriomyces hyalinus]
MNFNPTKTKVQLKLAINRLKLLQQKKSAANKNARRDIAQLLAASKDDSARVRVELVIREDCAVEALEIVELYCELLLARFGLLEMMRVCDPAIEEAVNTVIYAAARLDVLELRVIKDQLSLKFGKDFAMAALENSNHCVNQRIVHKLGVQPPDPILVDQYLKAIANAFNVPWEGAILPRDDLLNAVPPPAAVSLTDFTLPNGNGPESEFKNAAPGDKELLFHHSDPASSILPTVSTSVPDASVSSTPDFDALTKRFEALKRKM